MRLAWFASTFTVVLAAGVAASAQPVIIPLETQKPEQNTPSQQSVVSAPPVAPPQAGPSLPATTDVARDAPAIAPQEETAAQPAPPR